MNFRSLGQNLVKVEKTSVGDLWDFSNGGPYRTRICDLYHVKVVSHRDLSFFSPSENLTISTIYTLKSNSKLKLFFNLLLEICGAKRKELGKIWHKFGQSFNKETLLENSLHKTIKSSFQRTSKVSEVLSLFFMERTHGTN